MKIPVTSVDVNEVIQVEAMDITDYKKDGEHYQIELTQYGDGDEKHSVWIKISEDIKEINRLAGGVFDIDA